MDNPHTLINKFFGLHKIVDKNKKYYFWVMNNIFNSKKKW